MKPVFKLLCLACCFSQAVFGQYDAVRPEAYKAASIPDSLKKNTSIVERYHNRDIQIESAKKAVIKDHSIQTLLDDKAENASQFVLFYDKKFSGISAAEMRVYDSEGKLIKRYKKSDFYDRSAVDEASLITDGRLLAVNHDIVKYPVTIEKIYELNLNSYLDLSDWHIQENNIAIESSMCQVKVNPELGFRYNLKNTTQLPHKSTENNLDVYKWEFKNLPARIAETGSVSWTYLPHISFATTKAEYDDMPVDLSSWQEFGAWFRNLNQNMSELSPARVEQLKAMVAGANTDKDKARILYEFLQRNTRYVSIQLGIGGLKPFPANFVDEKKYGDCKALSNYMYTLLKGVGIKSHYALVRAGENQEPAQNSFVSDPFNHVILCIPFEKDTTWLECTSNTQPFGVLGSFTENRNALLITENGGKLVNTPKSRAADNVFRSDERVVIEADGSAAGEVIINASGEYRNMFIGISKEKTDDQKEFMLRYLNLKQPEELELSAIGDSAGNKVLKLKLWYSKLNDMMAGGKYFYRSRLTDLWRSTLPLTSNRKSDYYFEHPMRKESKTTYVLPREILVETLPANVNRKFQFGSYATTYNYDAKANEIQILTSFEITTNRIPAADYTELQSFMEEIAKSLSKKMIFKKKEG